MNSMSNYVTQQQLEDTLKKNNEELTSTITGNIVDQISEIMGDMMQQIDTRFNKVEGRLDRIELRVTAIEERLDALEVESKERFNSLMATIDGFVKRLDDMETENAARDAQFARLQQWAKEVSKKTGIPMPQL